MGFGSGRGLLMRQVRGLGLGIRFRGPFFVGRLRFGSCGRGLAGLLAGFGFS